MSNRFPFAAATLAVAASLAATPVQADWGAGAPAPYIAVAPQGPPPPGRPTQITVFEFPNYQGRKLVFERSVPSLAALDFNDRVGSVQIKGPRDWVLCEHRNFMGTCARIRGKANTLKRFKLDGKVSSLYPVPDPPKKKPK